MSTPSLPAMFAGLPLVASCRFCGKTFAADRAIVSDRGFTYCNTECVRLDEKHANA